MRKILAILIVLLAAWRARAADPPVPLVIPFDFESQFDQGRYGRRIGDMLWTKLARQGGFVLPESMLDVRSWSERHRLQPNPDTPLAEMRRIVTEQFGGQIAIWGKVELVAGETSDVYDLWINIADFSGEETRVILQTKARTKTVSEIPHRYIAAALDRLAPRSPPADGRADGDMESRWRENPHLVAGDFEAGGEAPRGWDPLPDHVAWTAVADERGAVNHVVRFSFPERVAASTGVLYYSNFFPVEAGATYRLSCRWRSTGSAAKVFVKCYDELESKYGGNSSSTAAATQRREVYRSQQNLRGAVKQWNVHVQDFVPSHTRFSPKWGRVMLYAYWPAGTVDWDQIVVKQIAPPPAAGDFEALENPEKTRKTR